MRRILPLLFVCFTASSGASGQPVSDPLMDWDEAEALRVRLRASVVPLLLVPRDSGPLLLPGHQGTATAVSTPDGPRLVTASPMLAGGARPVLVLSEERRVPARVLRTNGLVSVLAVNPWPVDVVPLPLAPTAAEATGGDLLILSNVWSFGHEVLTRGGLVEGIDDPVLGQVWLTNVVSPDGTPLLTSAGALVAVPFARYGPETTLAAGVERIRSLCAPLGRAADAEQPLPRRL